MKKGCKLQINIFNILQTYPRHNGASAAPVYVNDLSSRSSSSSTEETNSGASLATPNNNKQNGDEHSASVTSLKPFTCPSNNSILCIEELNKGIVGIIQYQHDLIIYNISQIASYDNS